MKRKCISHLGDHQSTLKITICRLGCFMVDAEALVMHMSSSNIPLEIIQNQFWFLFAPTNRLHLHSVYASQPEWIIIYYVRLVLSCWVRRGEKYTFVMRKLLEIHKSVLDKKRFKNNVCTKNYDYRFHYEDVWTCLSLSPWSSQHGVKHILVHVLLPTHHSSPSLVFSILIEIIEDVHESLDIW